MSEPTKEDREKGWDFALACTAIEDVEGAILAYAHGRASMRAEIMEATGGEGATNPTTAELMAHIRAMEAREVEGQLAQARALLVEIEKKEMWECWAATDTCEGMDCTCLPCRIRGCLEDTGGPFRAHLESEGNNG